MQVDDQTADQDVNQQNNQMKRNRRVLPSEAHHAH